MIFLWNRERVLSEVLELARLRISEKLDLPVELVQVHLKLEDDRLKPGFTVDTASLSDWKYSQIQDVLRSAWTGVQGILGTRLKSLHERRYGYGPQKEA